MLSVISHNETIEHFLFDILFFKTIFLLNFQFQSIFQRESSILQTDLLITYSKACEFVFFNQKLQEYMKKCLNQTFWKNFWFE